MRCHRGMGPSGMSKGMSLSHLHLTVPAMDLPDLAAVHWASSHMNAAPNPHNSRGEALGENRPPWFAKGPSLGWPDCADCPLLMSQIFWVSFTFTFHTYLIFCNCKTCLCVKVIAQHIGDNAHLSHIHCPVCVFVAVKHSSPKSATPAHL